MPTLDHVALEVSDLDAALAFYTGKLGLKLMFRQLDKEHHEAFAFLELEGGNLELLQVLDENNQPQARQTQPLSKSNCPHVALQAEDMDALLATCERQGIPIVKGPLEIPGQVRWVYLHDPDNNVLEYVQWKRGESSGPD